jgi:ADP-ribose pyrophosphatase YjhB (NUDIX family)
VKRRAFSGSLDAMKESAGTLLYRTRASGLEVLIIKPGGFAARYGWSIPKGIVEAGEDPEAAARRETREETGVEAGSLEILGIIEYTKSRKRIHCFFGRAQDGEPRQTRDFEVAEARFVDKDEARRLLHRDQQALIDMLETRLAR